MQAKAKSPAAAGSRRAWGLLGSVSRLQRLQVIAHLRGGLVAQLAVLLQRLVDDFFQLGRKFGFNSRAGTGVRLRIAS